MKQRYIFLTLLLFIGACITSWAQDPFVRYVSVNGLLSNDGKSWATAKNNLQNAINELHRDMKNAGKTEGGKIYVTGGTYKPTESTEEIAGGVRFTAFKMYGGIEIYGGFNPEKPEATPEQRVLKTKEGGAMAWDFEYETILSGCHATTTEVQFEWQPSRNRYKTTFPGNSYHVVWFATNGFDAQNRALPLGAPSLVDGCIIEGGDADGTSMNHEDHTSYGGGAYMVEGAKLNRCIVRKNESSARGGGVYLDNGGEVSYCFIHTNQSLGKAIQAGIGGGVCVDDKGLVTHSIIHNNVARMGGGLALTQESAVTVADHKDAAAAGCVVSNNTAQTEAGGMYILKGGIANHMTIVKNRCVGASVVIGQQKYGLTGGVFVAKSCYIANSVVWGNERNGDSHAQYAAYVQNSTQDLKPTVDYTAVSHNEQNDWTGTLKNDVLNLANTNVGGGNMYPDFIDANGDMVAIDTITAGVVMGSLEQATRRWQPAGTSPLREHGVQITNFKSKDAEERISHITEDLRGDRFLELTSLGALVPRNVQYLPRLVASQEEGENVLYYSFFVDPNASAMERSANDGLGYNWDLPLAYINNVAEWVDYYKADGKTFAYIDSNGVRQTGGKLEANTVIQVFVKEGTIKPAGYSLYANVRSSYIHLVDYMRVYGSVPTGNKGVDVSDRNVITNTTEISADVMNLGYAYNACHILAYGGASHTIFEDFKLVYANATTNDLFDPKNKNGAGIVIDSETVGANDAVNNIVRNCVIANNKAEHGAAVYIRSERAGSQVGITFENCVFRNNTSYATTPSTIYVESTEYGSDIDVKFNHCTIVKNVGYGLRVLGSKAKVTMNNSIVWANASEAFDNSEDLATNNNKVRTFSVENDAVFKGDYVMIGSDQDMIGSDQELKWLTNSSNKLTYVRAEGNYNYPEFVNPTKNIGHSEENDRTVYGGATNYMPGNMNPIVNAAGQGALSYDVVNNARNYGGLPDIGAYENTALPAGGKVIYVRDLGNTNDPGGDGLSWATAINGNCTTYTNNHGFFGYDLEVYAANTALTGLQWAVDEAYYRSLEKNNGTIKQYSTSGVWKDGGWRTTSITHGKVQEGERVQVWVAEGEYLRREGFFMRDGVDVYGGFPNLGNPGMTERAPKTYETIIETNTDAEVAANNVTWGPSLSMEGLNYYYYELNDNYDVANTTQRVLTQQFPYYEGAKNEDCEKINTVLVGFNFRTKWDGFTIKNGRTRLDHYKDGGAGVALRHNGVIENCVVKNNINKAGRLRGGGIFCNKGEILNCEIIGNITDASKTGEAYGGGLYMRAGLSYNSSYLKNEERGYTTHDGAACFFEDGLFYNNTISGNKGDRAMSTIAWFDKSSVDIYNCIIVDNELSEAAQILLKGKTGFNIQVGNCLFDPDLNPWYIEQNAGYMILNNNNNHQADPQFKDAANGDYSLKPTSPAINNGTDFLRGLNNSSEPRPLKLPEYDAQYNPRIQDCTVDIGAYEYNGAYNITPIAGKSFSAVGNQTVQSYGVEAIRNSGGGAVATGTPWTLYMDVTNENGSSYNQWGSALFAIGTNPVPDYPHPSLQLYLGSSNNGNQLKIVNGSISAYQSANVVKTIDNVTATTKAFSLVLDYDGNLSLKVIATVGGDAKEFDCTLTQKIGEIQNFSFALPSGMNIASMELKTATDELLVESNQAIFYVTQNGAGLASASNPANAACMQKLQKVLDAAGRYKFEHPGKQVIVKLEQIADDGGYAPSRSLVTDLNSREVENPSTYSLMVPRGVEVWGGYKLNGNFNEADRNIIQNPTKLTGAYTADGQNVNCYHIVTFTDHLFDENGEMIGDGHSTTSWNGVSNPSLADKVTDMGVYHRAVLDGLFLEDGRAVGEVTFTDSDQREENVHRYGGAAIVTNYAHVRNCVLENNAAADGGGALFMEEGGLVSGCVMRNNTAQSGGAIYVKQAPATDYDIYEWANIRKFAHVFGCTIVDNEASYSGGGLWFNNNVRVTNTLLWSNEANDGANVSGFTDPYTTSVGSSNLTDYPFAYSAVENIKIPGHNNIDVSSEESKGVRFVDKSVDQYFYLKQYSVLTRAGMDVANYTTILTDATAESKQYYFPTLESYDMAGNARLTYNRNGATVLAPAENKDFMEIGARAYNGPLRVVPTSGNLMQRLFVAKSENVDQEVYEKVLNSRPDYLIGSSFATPFVRLDDALHYVQEARKTLGNQQVTINGKQVFVRNLPFEIFVSAGTYSPLRTIHDQKGSTRENTYLVPEGVSIFGGLKVECATNTFYGQSATKGTDVTVDGVTLKGAPTSDILATRKLMDLNENSVLEPWEMEHQTILSGECVNAPTAESSYHVITCMADPDYVGALPDGTTNSSWSDNATDEVKKTKYRTKGMPIVLSGLRITDGNALNYISDDLENAYFYYKGGGVLVDGNWTTPDDGKATTDNDSWENVDHQDVNLYRVLDRNAVGLRNIPLVIHACDFTNNRAGEGGAIYSNGNVEIYQSSFTQNRAKYQNSFTATLPTGVSKDALIGNGNGGAVYSTYLLTAVNSIFENNEAGAIENADHDKVNNDSRGGAIYQGAANNQQQGSVQMTNCNIVRNMAPTYPAVYICSPNKGGREAANNPHKIVNSLFWGNDVTPGCSGKNFVVNYAKLNGATEVANATDFSDETVKNLTIAEMLWFSAYESGRGRKAINDLDTGIDYRAIPYTLNSYIPNLYTDYLNQNGLSTNYSCVTNNVELSENNGDLNGPNFMLPSLVAGADNYSPSSNWLMMRSNELTDRGWTMVPQTVTTNADAVSYGFDVRNAHGIYADTKQESNLSYPFVTYPLGTEPYMKYAETEDNVRTMYRVSNDPIPTQTQTFIDIGVYEYLRSPLVPETGNEVDILWVSTEENPENGVADGSSFERPTADLQRAIETLLASRNNHHKQINIIEGEYQPIYTIDNHLSFTVNTGSLNHAAVFPEGAQTAPSDLGVKSLKICGGWSKDIKNERDAIAYPTVIRMTSRSSMTAAQVSSIFRITDAHNWYNKGTDASPISGSDYTGTYGTTMNREDQRILPITFEGLVLSNPNGTTADFGAAIHYADQKNFEMVSDKNEVVIENNQYQHTDKLSAPSLGTDGKAIPKLTLNAMKLMRNGDDKDVSAVKIGQGGGYALVVNSVFHTNAGKPLDAYNTQVVNSTFALNGRKVSLQDNSQATTTASSAIHNSILWMNNGNGAQYELVSNALYNNALSGSYSSVSAAGVIADLGTNNLYLSTDNSDVLEGPNFVSPNVEATDVALQERRDFSLRPSARTINQGNTTNYNNLVNVQNCIKDDTNPILKNTANYDHTLVNARVYADKIDLGAYEYQNSLQRVFYVNPMVAQSGNGASWATAFGNGTLRDAIDMAAVYSSVNHGERAYVFSKGGRTDEQIVARQNVSVYGGIESNYWAEVADQNYEQYVNQLLGERVGIVADGANPTIISGISSSQTLSAPALIDGFVVAPPQRDVDAPVVDIPATIDSYPLVVRNVEVRGVNNTSTSDVAGARSAVRAQSGLLYNVLVHDFTDAEGTAAATYIGSNAIALNCTFLGNGASAYAVETAADAKVVNSITYNDLQTTDKLGRKVAADTNPFENCNIKTEGYPFARYLQGSTNEALWYQLEELSKQMDVADATTGKVNSLLTGIGIPSDDVSKYVHYATDRDLLGNPRQLQFAQRLDRGCFETWNVPTGVVAEATYNENGKRYPQAGSVVYIHEGANLLMNAADFNAERKGSDIVVRPGYLLLKDGASLYGHGAMIALSHVGVERQVGEHGALVALPYKYDYAQARKVTYDDTQHVSETQPTSFEVMTYDGAERAAFGYHPTTNDSQCWKSASGEQAACTGVYYAAAEGTYRFTVQSTDAVYREGFDGETRKTVMLMQYDSRDFANDQPQFTAVENMGWNLVGVPYLVANYKGGTADGTASLNPTDYALRLPRMLYSMDANGGFSAQRSWDAKVQNVSCGYGIFTQTAVKEAQESLVFARPTYNATSQTATQKRTLMLTDADGYADALEVVPATDGDQGSAVYTYGRDAVKWMALNEQMPQVYIGARQLGTLEGTRFAIMGNAPIAEELALGVKTADCGTITFSLPTPEAFETFNNVWLTDYVAERVTNLKLEDYEAQLESNAVNEGRFTIKFGGEKPRIWNDMSLMQYQVYGQDGVLHVEGLRGNEVIRIYDATGRLQHCVVADGGHYQVALTGAVYIVRVDNEVHKVQVF